MKSIKKRIKSFLAVLAATIAGTVFFASCAVGHIKWFPAEFARRGNFLGDISYEGIYKFQSLTFFDGERLITVIVGETFMGSLTPPKILRLSN